MPLGFPKRSFFGTNFGLTEGIHALLQGLMERRGQTATEVGLAALSLSKALTKEGKRGRVLVLFKSLDPDTGRFWDDLLAPKGEYMTVPDDLGWNHRGQGCPHRLVMEMPQKQLDELTQLASAFGGARDFFLWRGVIILAGIETGKVVAHGEVGQELFRRMQGGEFLYLLRRGPQQTLHDLEPFDYRRAIARNPIDARPSKRAPALE